VEVHSQEEVEKALGAGTRLIGINNRNLNTFKVDLRTTEKLAKLIPKQVVKISESGIFTRADVLDLQNLGIDAVLVGQAIIKSGDPSLKISELLGRKVEVSTNR
jgi:indole-3-glycerol phosphate synthase